MPSLYLSFYKGALTYRECALNTGRVSLITRGIWKVKKLNKKILIATIVIVAVSIAGTGAYYAFLAQNTSAKGTLVVQPNVSGVAVTFLGPEETLKTGITGAKGEVTFTGMPGGSYEGIATKEGYAQYYMSSINVRQGGRVTLPITMTEDISGSYPSSNPAALIIKQGSTGTTTVTIPSAGLTGAVSLSCAQLPSGVTATFDPAGVTFTGDGKVTSTLTLTVSSTATKGIYTSIMLDMSGEGVSGGSVFGLLLQVS